MAMAAAAGEGTFSFSVASVVENVLQQHGNRHRELDLESRRAEEAGMNFLNHLFLQFSPEIVV